MGKFIKFGTMPEIVGVVVLVIATGWLLNHVVPANIAAKVK